jgi:hypothetical protein
MPATAAGATAETHVARIILSCPDLGLGVVLGLDVSIKLQLQRLLVLFAVGSMTRALRSEGNGGARSAAGFNGNVAQPFCYANRRFLHGRFIFFGLSLRPSGSQADSGASWGRAGLTRELSAPVRKTKIQATQTHHQSLSRRDQYHASARFRLLIASSISCVFLKPTVAESTPAFWKANLIALTRSS